MQLLAHWVSHRASAVAIVLLTAVLAVVSFGLAGQVRQDDDLLAFLPEGNADIETFYAINKQFGGLDVALVGVEGDVFSPDFIEALQRATQGIDDTEGVDYVLSLTNVEDFTVDPMGGIIADRLVPAVPTTQAEQIEIERRVLSRDAIVGNLVSEGGDAVLIYVFAAYGTQPRELAGAVERVVNEAFPDDQANPKYWGGAPFISTYIYDTSQADMKRLTPWAVLAIVIIILVAFRDWVGSILALVSTVMGIGVSQAAMVLLDVEFNIVLSAMPVILFAVGSAYAIHILSRYYANAAALDNQDLDAALRKTMLETAPVVMVAGLTTVAGLLSFLMMDIRPMRTFGLFTALGIFTTLVLSVTFVPSVVHLTRLRGKAGPKGGLKRLMVRLSVAAHNRPTPFFATLAVVTIVAAFFVSQVDNRMDQSSFMSRDSPPDLAQRFLDRNFGGSQFLQVYFEGDMTDPVALREMRRIADRMSLVPHVSQVLIATEPISLLNQAMQGVRRIPDTSGQVRTLYSFLRGNASVSQLINDARDGALVHIKIDSNRADDLDMVTAAVERVLSERPGDAYAVASRDGDQAVGVRSRLTELVWSRVMALSHAYGVSVDGDALRPAIAASAPATPTAAVIDGFRAYLLSEEVFVELSADEALAVATVTAELGPAPDELLWMAGMTEAIATERLRASLGDAPMPEELPPGALEDEELLLAVDDLFITTSAQLELEWKLAYAAAKADGVVKSLALTPPGGAKGERYLQQVRVAFIDLDNPTAMVASATGEVALTAELSGLPVLYRGMSESVTTNQIKSLALALAMVCIIMTLMFRSVFSGVLATIPTALTLVVVYGGMGFLGVHLDIGTSMLASIIIGAGVDYSVHLMAAFKGRDVGQGLRRAVDDAAPGIWTNALMVAAGFFVLTLGDAKPLQNVGGLTAAAMLVAAAMTFLAIPILGRKATYWASSEEAP